MILISQPTLLTAIALLLSGPCQTLFLPIRHFCVIEVLYVAQLFMQLDYFIYTNFLVTLSLLNNSCQQNAMAGVDVE